MDAKHLTFDEMSEYVLDCQRKDWEDNPHDRLKYFRLPYTWSMIKTTEFHYFGVFDAEKLIGVVEYFKKIEHGSCHFCYISVDAQYRNTGVSKRLIEAFCQKMALDGSAVYFGSMFSDDGKAFVMKNLVTSLEKRGIEWSSENEGMMELKKSFQKQRQRNL